MSDNHGFKVSIVMDRFNKLDVFVDAEVEDFVVDAHFEALDRYDSYLLSLLSKRIKMVVLAKDLLSVGRIKWNFAKIYRKMQRVVESILKKLYFVRSRDQGGER